MEYQKAQSIYLSTPFVIPKKVDVVFSKLPKTNQKIIKTLCDNFNTKWQNIVIREYFRCGFEIYSTKFTYRKLLDPRVLKRYIERDKSIKREDGITEEQIRNDVKFIKKWMLQHTHIKGSNIMEQYCVYLEDGIKAPIKHFLENNINKYTLVWLISSKALFLTEEEKRLLPLVMENYWRYSNEVIALEGGRFGS